MQRGYQGKGCKRQGDIVNNYIGWADSILSFVCRLVLKWKGDHIFWYNLDANFCEDVS